MRSKKGDDIIMFIEGKEIKAQNLYARYMRVYNADVVMYFDQEIKGVADLIVGDLKKNKIIGRKKELKESLIRFFKDYKENREECHLKYRTYEKSRYRYVIDIIIYVPHVAVYAYALSPKKQKVTNQDYELGREIANKHSIEYIFEEQKKRDYRETIYNDAVRHKLGDMLGARYSLSIFNVDELSGVKNTERAFGLYNDHIFYYRETKAPYKPKFITLEPYKSNIQNQNIEDLERRLDKVNPKLIETPKEISYTWNSGTELFIVTRK